MELTREELEIIDQAFEYISDTSGVKPEENELWDKIKGVLENEQTDNKNQLSCNDSRGRRYSLRYGRPCKAQSHL